MVKLRAMKAKEADRTEDNVPDKDGGGLDKRASSRMCRLDCVRSWPAPAFFKVKFIPDLKSRESITNSEG